MTFLYGPNLVVPTDNTVESVVKAFNDRIAILGERPDILARIKLSDDECEKVLTHFPNYKKCFQESGNLIILTKQ
jgi:hypothetical protein